MTIAYVDTEFNGHVDDEGRPGELISIGMVTTDGAEFYRVVRIPEKPVHWVTINVLPNLIAAPQTSGLRAVAYDALNWLAEQQVTLVMGDWPADLIHFLSLWYPDSTRAKARNYGMRFELVPRCQLNSVLEHNALSDAWALYDAHLLSRMPRIEERPMLAELLKLKAMLE